MPGPVTAMQPIGDEERLRSTAPGTAAPPPSWMEAAKANLRLNQDDEEDYQELYQRQAYKGVEDELVRAGYPRSRYNRDEWKSYFGFDVLKQRDQLWADVTELRQRSGGKAFANIPQTREEFETWAARRQGERDKDVQTAQQGGFGTAIVPGFGFGLLRMGEPQNLIQIPMGGFGRTTAGTLLRQFGAGAVGTIGTSAQRVKARGEMGEIYTSDQMAFDAGVGGAANAGFVGGFMLANKGGKLAYNQLPFDWRLAQQLKREVPVQFRTPEQQAAIHVIERGAEIDATSPYVGTIGGYDAHAARLQGTLETLDSLPVAAAPLAAVAPAPAARAAAAARPRVEGGGLDTEAALQFIVRDLEGGAQLVTDSGGLTKYGISQKGNPGVDIANLTEGQAMAIYRRKYLGPLRLEGLSGEAQLVALDASINHGPGFAGRMIRESGGDPAVMMAMRRAEYARLVREDPGKYARYADGWENRLQKLEARGGIEGGGVAPDSIAIPVRPDALDAARPVVTVAGPEVQLQSFKPGDIGVDAGLMQFKSGGDAFGVTERLRGVTSWDPVSAGTVTVWEALDGRRLIADGHQRLGLANRLQAQDPTLDINLNAFVLREADGYSAASARAITALKNLREGSGTATDAAKVLREVGADEALVASLPQRGREGAVVRDGRALASLSDEAFGAVVNKVIPESHAAAIGALAPDPATHMGLVELLAAVEPANRRQAEGVVRQAIDAGFVSEHQAELFGSREVTSSLFIERAKVLDKTLSELRKLKGAFGVAARNADALDAAGNRIDVTASEAAAAANSQALAIVDQLALRKGNAVNAIITRAAERVANGEPSARVVRDAVAELQQLDLAAAIRDTDGAGGPAGAGRYDGDPAGEDAAGRGDASPAELDALEAEGQGGFAFADEATHKAFDDPAGPGVKAASESVWHDIRAGQDAAAEARLQAEVAAVHARGLANQAELAKVGGELGGEGVEFVNPGAKSPERIAEKVRLEGYASAAELTDTARAAFVIEDPAAGDMLAAAIAERFPGTVDRSWKQLGSGYLDRKLIVRFADGSAGELQLVPRAVWEAKKAGGNGLYKAGRVESDPAVRADLLAQSRALYGRALAGSDFVEIAARSAAGKRAANSAGDSGSPSSADLTNSPGASRQVPLDQAQARPDLPEASTATGRSSTSNNSSFTEGPPLGDRQAASMAGRESQGPSELFDLGDGKGARPIGEIMDELDADDAAIVAMRECL